MRIKTSLWNASIRDWNLTSATIKHRFSEDQAKSVIRNVEKLRTENKPALDALNTVQDERQMARLLS